MSWVPYEHCHCIITLTNRNCYKIDWVRWPGLYWVVSNGTEWLCSTNLWPRHPPGWTGQYPMILLDTRLFKCQFKHDIVSWLLVQVWHIRKPIFHWYDHSVVICVCVFRRIGVYNHSYWSLNKIHSTGLKQWWSG